MALNFNGTTHQVDFGSAGSLDDLGACTFMFIYRPTTLDTTFRYLWRKFAGPGGTNINHNNSDLEFARVYVTTNLAAISTGNIISASNWYITFFVDGGVGVAPRIYHAQLGNTLTEPSYAQQDTPVGALTTDASATALVGIRDSTRRFVGDIARVAVWDQAFSLKDCRQNYWRFLASPNLHLFCELGYGHGVGSQLDWSGNQNDGTVTGATLIKHPPVLFPIMPKGAAGFPMLQIGGGPVAENKRRSAFAPLPILTLPPVPDGVID